MKIKCNNCGDIIESLYRHHFCACSCFKNEYDNEGVAIDGGKDYIKITGTNYTIVEEEEDEKETANDNI